MQLRELEQGVGVRSQRIVPPCALPAGPSTSTSDILPIRKIISEVSLPTRNPIRLTSLATYDNVLCIVHSDSNDNKYTTQKVIVEPHLKKLLRSKPCLQTNLCEKHTLICQQTLIDT